MIITLNLARHTSVKIGQVQKVRVLREVCGLENGEFLLGGGFNLLVSPTPPPLAILGDEFDYIKQNSLVLEVGAFTKSTALYRYAKAQNIGGFELLAKIPGRMGGLIKMNAGLSGLSISDNLLCVLTKKGWQDRSEFDFSYRHSGINEPIFAAKFAIHLGFDNALALSLSQKRQNQPKGASFGSCFKNPAGDFAGRLIEAVGLRGHINGGAMFSPLHANFLINFNQATFDDAMGLINLAKSRVLDSFGIELEPEVVIV